MVANSKYFYTSATRKQSRKLLAGARGSQGRKERLLGDGTHFRSKTKLRKEDSMKARTMFLGSLLAIGILCGLFLGVSISLAATYYIDWDRGSDDNDGLSQVKAWKRAPGMVGFKNPKYKHQAGDKFVFRGGTTWPRECFPFKIAYAGAKGKPDIYTSDSVWGMGLPVFDGEGTIRDVMVQIQDKSYVTFDRIKLYRIGTPGGSSKEMGFPIKLLFPDNVTISNCRIEAYAFHGILVQHYGEKARTNVNIIGNDISHATNSIEIGSRQLTKSTNSLTNITIRDNKVHDSHVMLREGDHADGIHVFGYNSPGPSFKRVRIFNNRFYGDWGPADNLTWGTAQIYFGEGVDGADIYNNVLSFDNTSSIRNTYMFSPGMIFMNRVKNIKIYNNTISSDSLFTDNAGMKAGIVIRDVENVQINNNLISKTEFGIHLWGNVRGTVRIDRNHYDLRNKGWIGMTDVARLKTLADWQSKGYDITGSEGDPDFANTSSKPMDLAPRVPQGARGWVTGPVSD